MTAPGSGLGVKIADLSQLRIPPGMQNTTEQRRRALVFALQHAQDRADLLELTGMLGLGPDLEALRAAP